MSDELMGDTREAALKSLAGNGWILGGDRDAITKTFKFSSFVEAFGWMTRMALVAEKISALRRAN